MDSGILWLWRVGLGRSSPVVISGSVRPRGRDPTKWIVELRTKVGGNAPPNVRKIWLGTFDTQVEAQLAFEAAQFLMTRKDYDAVLLGHYRFPEYIPGVCLYTDFVKNESKRYATLRMTTAADLFLNKLPGQPEIPPPVIASMVFTSISIQLNEAGLGRNEIQWMFDAAEHLTGRRAYNAQHFGHHVFRTHNDLGGLYRDFVIRESRRYAEFKRHAPAVNRFLNKLPGQPEIPPPVIAHILFKIISIQLEAGSLSRDEAQWAVDAAEYLTGRTDYNAQHFEHHLFWTHNDLGGSYRDFVIRESRRYSNLRMTLEMDRCLLEPLPDLTIFDEP